MLLIGYLTPTGTEVLLGLTYNFARLKTKTRDRHEDDRRDDRGDDRGKRYEYALDTHKTQQT